VRRGTISVICALGLLQAAGATAQSEQQLRQAFEGQYVIVKMELPASQLGVDMYPMRDPAIDFKAYSARIREYGTSLRSGDRVLVTTVRVKKKNIEFQLGGGGYGVFGDDHGSVYVPTVSKSRREKELEDALKYERDYERRRRMQRELDDLKADRERENRDRDMDRRMMEERKKSEIAQKRLDAGSRINLWFPDGQLEYQVPTVAEMRRMLAQVIDFGTMEARPTSRPSAFGGPAPRGPEPPASRGSSGGGGDVRRGMNEDEVHDVLGEPTRKKAGKQGELSTLTEWYEEGDRVTEVVYVGGVVVRFSTSSK